MPATTRIVLFGAARSGTSLLRGLLASPAGVLFAGDLFHPNAARLSPRLAGLLPPVGAARDADPIGYLGRLADACPEPIFGFKWNLGHARAVRDHCIAAAEWRVVILYRDNILATYASALRATAAQRWNRRVGDAAPAAPAPPVRFDPVGFARRHDQTLRHLDQLLRGCADAGKVFSLIEYTELQRPELVANLARQLGYPDPGALQAPVRKTGDRNILARFSNPDAAAAAIAALRRPDWAYEWGPRFALPEPRPPAP